MRNATLNLLANDLVIAIALPLTIVAIGAVGNKLVRGCRGWRLSDCYLGREIALATIAAEVLHLVMLARSLGLVKPEAVAVVKKGLIVTAVYGAISVLLFLFILGCHQGLTLTSSHSNRQRVVIGVGTTVLAIVLFFGFVLLTGRT